MQTRPEFPNEAAGAPRRGVVVPENGGGDIVSKGTKVREGDSTEVDQQI